MVKNTTEMNLKVLKARLLTKAEYKRFSNLLPLPDYLLLEGWWLADADEIGNVSVANPGGVCSLTGAQNSDIYVRVALDIEGDIKVGEEFIHHGVVFTALSNSVAISNNFLSKTRYHDEELIKDYRDSNDWFNSGEAWEEENDRINAITSTLLEQIESLYGPDEVMELDDDILIGDFDSEDEYEIDKKEEDEEDDNDGFLHFDFSGRRSEVPGAEGDLYLLEHNNDDSNRCKKCHYYDMCDEKDEETKYCPSYREKK